MATAIIGLASAEPYQLHEAYVGEDFFSKWDFFTAPDPTRGFTKYVDGPTAMAEGLAKAMKDGVYMGVDMISVANPKHLRHAVRIQSKATFNEGLFIVDVEHMPTGCGTWPAFWMYGEDADHIWPAWGEYDIIETSHNSSSGFVTLHTSKGCSQKGMNAGQSFTETWENGADGTPADDCYVHAPGQWNNQGCSQSAPDASAGPVFNARGGGTFAGEWDPRAGHIRTWFWPVGTAPRDVQEGRPAPETWGTPASAFSLAPDVCSPAHLKNMRLVFNVALCGDLGSPTFAPACPSEAKTMTCEQFVGDPRHMTEAYWYVRSLDVYFRGTALAGDPHAVTAGPAPVAQPTASSSTAMRTTAIPAAPEPPSAMPEQVQGPQRLTIKNACSREPIWIAHEAGSGVGVDKQNIRIRPDETKAFLTPAGLSATRYWPKMGCNDNGNNCDLGDSGGPGESCVRRPPDVPQDDYSRCAPPIDSKFEGTFDSNGFDFVDMSLVDGWTLPFTLKLSGGECTSQKGSTTNLFIDCSDLNMHDCPREEHLTAAGISVDLRAVNPTTKRLVGCYAPCQKLMDDKFNNTISKGRLHDDPEVAPYCCSTPPESPEACRIGPITTTRFLGAVHSKCPGVYGYAYDDGMGLLKCTPSTTYELTYFCPSTEQVLPERPQVRSESTTVAHTTIEPDSSSAPDAVDREKQAFVWQNITVGGVSPAVFAGVVGHGGESTGDLLKVYHGTDLTLFSTFDRNQWEFDRIVRVRPLGRRLSFIVDLSRVGCGCNLAIYLTALPAVEGNPSSADARERGIPPYYCDVKGVGGHFCPEIDLMEANTAAFQATPHKCEALPDGAYSECDRGGCAQNTRGDPSTYGAGPTYAIDTTLPFEVHTEFFEEAGTLTGIRTTLRQVWRQVELDHHSCNTAYLAQISTALNDGMSLRISYNGGGSGEMAWLDSPPCGVQSCTHSNAGHAVISHFAVGPRILGAPPWSGPTRTGTPKAGGAGEWVVSDPNDVLFGDVVPADLVNDPTRFVHQGRRGFVSWRGSTHLVKERERESQTTGNKPAWVVSDPGDVLFGKRVPEEIINDPQLFVKMGGRGLVKWMHASHLVELQEMKHSEGVPLADMVIRRYEHLPSGGRVANWSPILASPILTTSSAVIGIACLAILCFRPAHCRMLHFQRHLTQTEVVEVPLLLRTVSDDVTTSIDDAL